MLLIFGTTIRNRVLTLVRFICEYCRMDADQQVTENATKVSVFFVPLFTVSRRYSVTCTRCGGTTALTKEQATHGMQWAEQNRPVTN
ncbi:MAG: zinc-ribbon domain-containing protein [Mycetocola sp.]